MSFSSQFSTLWKKKVFHTVEKSAKVFTFYVKIRSESFYSPT
jgi:hypothetical protein